MKILILGFVVSLMSVPAHAGLSFCYESYDKKFNAKIDQKYRKEYCNNNGSLKSEKFMKDFGLTEKELDDSFYTQTEWFGNGNSATDIIANLEEAIYQRDELKKIAGKSFSEVLDAKQAVALQTSDSEDIIKLLEDKQKLKDSTDLYFNEARTEAYEKCYSKSKSKKKCRIKANNIAEKVSEKKAKDELAEIIKEQANLKDIKLKNKAIGIHLKKTQDKFKNAYEKRFSPHALEVFSDHDIKPAPKNFEAIQEICFSTESPPKGNELKACEELKVGADGYVKMNKSIDDQISKIEELDSPLEMLFLKLDNNILKNKVAKGEIQDKIQEGLKDTVLGSIMDQMREDMCNVAKAPDTMCVGDSFTFSAFVDDSGKVAKELQDKTAVETFQKRSTATKD